ncbi:hypothetical protein V1279_007114 [Bradyrhizobium sp. AZCC 1610]
MLRRKPSPKHGAMQTHVLQALKSLYFQAYRTLPQPIAEHIKISSSAIDAWPHRLLSSHRRVFGLRRARRRGRLPLRHLVLEIDPVAR